MDMLILLGVAAVAVVGFLLWKGMDTVKNSVKGATDTINSLPSNIARTGSNLVENYVRGSTSAVTSGIKDITSAMNEGSTSTVKSWTNLITNSGKQLSDTAQSETKEWFSLGLSAMSTAEKTAAKITLPVTKTVNTTFDSLFNQSQKLTNTVTSTAQKGIDNLLSAPASTYYRAAQNSASIVSNITQNNPYSSLINMAINGGK